MDAEHPDLVALRRRLEDEEAAYASLLGAVDALASFPLPVEAQPQLPEQQQKLNGLWSAEKPPGGKSLAARRKRGIWDAVAPALGRQEQFNATLVQLLNGHLDEASRLHARLRDLAAALVRYLQRVLPLVDARDRVSAALATTRSELILEAFDRRLEKLGRRLEGLLALRDRLESVSEEVRAIRRTLDAAAPPPAVAAAARQAAADARYTAFENRYRGDRDEIRRRLADYFPAFRDLAPVVDLGCGRGEFLELLKEAGVEARGVESNANTVQECRAKGLDVVHGDLVDFLRAEKDAALGGVFAAQVVEHLPPAVLQDLLAEAHRALRPGGLMALETVNVRSVVGFLEVYNRDLTHERPLHPDTLSFLAAAAGFPEVRVEMRASIEPAARLQSVPPDGLPEAAARALNENVERLNGLLYGPQEYVLFARR